MVMKKWQINIKLRIRIRREEWGIERILMPLSLSDDFAGIRRAPI